MEDTFAVKLFRALQHASPEFAGWSSDGTMVQFRQNHPNFNAWFCTWSKQYLSRQSHTSMNWNTFKKYMGDMKFELRRDPACPHITCHDPQHWYCRMHPHFYASATEESIRENININPTNGKPYNLSRFSAPQPSKTDVRAVDVSSVVDGKCAELSNRVQELEARLGKVEQVVRELGGAVVVMADENLSLSQQQLQYYRHLRGLGVQMSALFGPGEVTAATSSTDTDSVNSCDSDKCSRPAKRQMLIHDFF